MSPSVLRTSAEFREACEAVRQSGKTLGLVPTMGALHAGHLALIEEAKRRATEVFVTIFVNPTQFGPGEDLDRYPRDLDGDLQKCGALGVSLVFAPDDSEMYPPGERTRVRVDEITQALCGASRPGHFEGVATIVTKLFVLAGRSVAVFGRKDYQQLQVIRRLAWDLLLPVEVIGHPTVREPDGLALSSRNAYLSVDERKAALAIPTALTAAVGRFAEGERSVSRLRQPVEAHLVQAGLEVDYVEIAEPDETRPLADTVRIGGRALLAVAARAGKTRLIDNVVLGEDPPPIASGAST